MAVGKLTRKGNALQVENVSKIPKILFIEEFALIHHFNEEVFAWMDKIKACGANGMRTVGIYVWDKGQEQEPFRKINSDYTYEFNEKFFEYMRRWVKYADERGIVIIYDLFDRCLFADRAGEYAPYDPFYPLVKGSINAFTDLKNSRLITIQKDYIRKVVETIKSLNVRNVILGVMNEFRGDARWYYEMTRYIKNDLNWTDLLAGSEEDSEAAADPNVDFWFVHTGNRDFLTSGTPHLSEDIDELRKKTGDGKVLGFSNDGFGDDGPRENPDDMRRMAGAAANKGLQLFAFMDHLAALNPPLGKLQPLNEATYRAIVEVFKPTPLSATLPPVALPKGMVYAFQARFLESAHSKAFLDNGSKVVAATTIKDYLCVSPTIKNWKQQPLPIEPLDAYFSLMIDENAKDNAIIAILDVCDATTKTVLANMAITRKQFPKAKEFTLFKLTFMPAKNSALTLRLFYFGEATLAVNKLALVEADALTLKAPKEIPDNAHSMTPTEEPPVDKPVSSKGVLYSYELSQCQYYNHPDVFLAKGVKAIKATTTKGFLAFGPYATGYPVKPLDAYFSVLIDNNTFDDAKILTLDVYDAFNKKILAKKELTRKQFPLAGDYSLFKLPFTPASQSKLEFRIYYEGYAYIAADWIVIADPAELAQIKDHSELLKLVQAAEPPVKGWTLAINDPLTNKTTKATQIVGGEWAADGCKITGKVKSYLRYDTNITGAIRVEFDAKGYISGEPMHGTNDQVSILVMQDVPHPTNWANWKTIDGFLFQLLKMAKYDATDGLKLKAGAALRTKFDGEWWTVQGDGLAGHPLAWDSSKTYHWEVAFEPGALEIKRDGQMIFQYWIDPLVFGKKNQPIVVYIGGDDGANNISPNNVTYSNVKIYRK